MARFSPRANARLQPRGNQYEATQYHVCAVCLRVGLLPGSAVSQQKSLKDQIVGSWTVASWEQTMKDGTKNHRCGSSPKGINTFDANGNFSLIMMRPDMPKISSNDAEKPSAQEAMAITKGPIAYYGTYTVDEASKTLSLKISGTTLANQLGTEQKRTISAIRADEMKYTTPISIVGGKIEVALKRAK
jgi:hypothetical protein